MHAFSLQLNEDTTPPRVFSSEISEHLFLIISKISGGKMAPYTKSCIMTRPDAGRRKKINLKPFEAPQRSMGIKTLVNFSFNIML